MPWELITLSIISFCLPLYHRWTPKTWIPNTPTSRWPMWHLSLRRRRLRIARPTLKCTTTSTASCSRRPSRSRGRSTGVWRSSARGAQSSPVRLPGCSLPHPTSPKPAHKGRSTPRCPPQGQITSQVFVSQLSRMTRLFTLCVGHVLPYRPDILGIVISIQLLYFSL